ncbi:MAG: hypothetical protein KGM24_06890 [Elusimicrobia bacterium]|nr:hypothetical protein [Elusimicrobiota bacterium]
MRQTLVLAVLAAALAAPVAAQTSLEALSAASGARFSAAFPASAAFRPSRALLDAAAVSNLEEELRGRTTLLQADSAESAAAAPAADVELAPLLNRQLKTSLRWVLNGRTVWFGGAFDSKQNAYVSITVDGSAPLYFYVRGLLDQEQSVSIGGRSYTLSLSANIFHKLNSKIVLTDDASGREIRFSIQDMLNAISAVGAPVRLSDQAYTVYYTDGVDGGRANPSARLFDFVYNQNGNFHVYLIPETSVPSDRLAVFSMFNGKRVGLVARGGRLQVYENP